MPGDEATVWLNLLGTLAIPAYLYLTLWVLARCWQPSWAPRHPGLHLALWSGAFALFCCPTLVFAGHGAMGLLPLAAVLMLLLAAPGEVGPMLSFLKGALPLSLFAGLALRVLLPQLGLLLVWILELHPPGSRPARGRSRGFSVGAGFSAAILVALVIAGRFAAHEKQARWRREEDPAYSGLYSMPSPEPVPQIQILSPQLDAASAIAPQAAEPE